MDRRPQAQNNLGSDCMQEVRVIARRIKKRNVCMSPKSRVGHGFFLPKFLSGC